MLRYDKYMNGMSVEEDDFPMKHSEFLEWLCVQRSLNTPVLSTVQSKTDIRDIGVFTYLNNLKRFKQDMKGIEMTKYFGFEPKLRKDGVPDEIPYIQDICCLCHLVDREYDSNIEKTCTEDNCEGDLIYRIDIELITVALCHIAMLEYVGAAEFADGTVSFKEMLKYNRFMYTMTLNENSQQRLYDEMDNVGSDLHEMLCYNITHVELSISMYGTSSHKHNAQEFKFEIEWIKRNMMRYINANHPEMVGEFVMTLRRFIATEDDDTIQIAIIYLMTRLTENFAPRIPNALKDRKGKYPNIKYHALYCIINGLL
jgi:hypothetical protein